MYDADGNGWVDLGEMTRVVKSIFKMMEKAGSPEKQAEDIFKRMDLNSDGRVTRPEFIQACIKDSKLLGLLAPNPRYITRQETDLTDKQPCCTA